MFWMGHLMDELHLLVPRIHIAGCRMLIQVAFGPRHSTCFVQHRVRHGMLGKRCFPGKS